MADDYGLGGKVAVITGAGGDVGSATAVLFAERGASVVAVDRDAAKLKALEGRMPAGSKFITVTADVTNEDSVAGYVKAAKDKFGRIDIFFNNAGIEGSKTGAWALTTDLSLEDFNEILSVNMTGVFLGLKHVIPVMADGGGGAICNTASINGIRGNRGQIAYVASKHAVVSMTQVTSKEYASKAIRVNCIAPGGIKGRMMTDFVQIIQANRPADETPPPRPSALARMADPREIAGLVGFLCSDEATYITGATYSVDGGLSAR
jgi:NAD(P)-dependent dehydrogenase (short-subunit alcohol dehydrogenase family)